MVDELLNIPDSLSLSVNDNYHFPITYYFISSFIILYLKFLFFQSFKTHFLSYTYCITYYKDNV